MSLCCRSVTNTPRTPRVATAPIAASSRRRSRRDSSSTQESAAAELGIRTQVARAATKNVGQARHRLEFLRGHFVFATVFARPAARVEQHLTLTRRAPPTASATKAATRVRRATAGRVKRRCCQTADPVTGVPRGYFAFAVERGHKLLHRVVRIPRVAILVKRHVARHATKTHVQYSLENSRTSKTICQAPMCRLSRCLQHPHSSSASSDW